MATLQKAINKSLFDGILPSFGSPRIQIPVWDNSQKMFICNEYESANGHRYYCGIRFCDRIVIVERVGLYHSWTYIDSIELYAFNGQKMELIQKRDLQRVKEHACQQSKSRQRQNLSSTDATRASLIRTSTHV